MTTRFRNPTAADIGKTVEVSQDGHEWQTGTLEQWTIDKDGNWFYVVDPLSRHGSFEFCRVPYSTPDPIAELSMAADKLVELGAPEAARVLMAEIERLQGLNGEWYRGFLIGLFVDRFYVMNTDSDYLRKDGRFHGTCGDEGFYETREEARQAIDEYNALTPNPEPQP